MGDCFQCFTRSWEIKIKTTTDVLFGDFTVSDLYACPFWKGFVEHLSLSLRSCKCHKQLCHVAFLYSSGIALKQSGFVLLGEGAP